MAVLSYEKNGETLWKIYINLRSKVDPTIRVQKLLIGFKNKAKAETEERIPSSGSQRCRMADLAEDSFASANQSLGNEVI